MCVNAFLLPSVQAQAATFFRSGTTAQNGNGSTSVTINVPSGVVAGDVMLAAVDAEGSGSFTVPSGWSSTGLFDGTSFIGHSGVYFHVAGASEPASYTWTLGTTRKAIGRITSYVGVDNASPIQTSANGGASTGTSATAPSITTSVANEMVVAGSGDDDTVQSTITAPGGTTKRSEVYTSGTGTFVGGEGVDFNQATAGATGSKTFTLSSSAAWGTITIGLRRATGALGFDLSPDSPTIPTVALNGQAQTTNATMGGLAVDDTSGSSPATGSGWNVTVVGDTAAGKSAVFKQYCNSGSACNGGADPANSYVSGGRTLAAGSLKLNSTGASWTTTGGAGTAPAFQCTSGCSVDAASATKIASAAVNGGMGPWSTSGLGATSLALSTPTTMRALPANEVYRVDLVWSVNSGP
jgi:hypothetical protein